MMINIKNLRFSFKNCKIAKANFYRKKHLPSYRSTDAICWIYILDRKIRFKFYLFL